MNGTETTDSLLGTPAPSTIETSRQWFIHYINKWWKRVSDPWKSIWVDSKHLPWWFKRVKWWTSHLLKAQLLAETQTLGWFPQKGTQAAFAATDLPACLFARRLPGCTPLPPASLPPTARAPFVLPLAPPSFLFYPHVAKVAPYKASYFIIQ